MGYAIAEALANRGVSVYLVSGPVGIRIQHPTIEVISVTTAAEMFEAAKRVYPKTKIAVFTAAVADFSPEFPLKEKIKKEGDEMTLVLRATPDIALELGKIKARGQVNIGFALETHEELENASRKLKKKNFDLIVLNSLQDKGAGFETDTNKISLIDKNNNIDNFELKSKKDVARDIVEKIMELIDDKTE